MSKLLTPSETADWLKERNNFLILTHKRPDGDTLGSAGALAQGLHSIGKTAYMLYNPEITSRYLKYVKEYTAPDEYIAEHIITVDTATVDLFPDNAQIYADSISLCIDHHESNTINAGYACIDAGRAACGELVFDILMAISDNISVSAARCLYVALSTDTGCFSFGNTTADTLYIASLLISAGVNNADINKSLFRSKTRSRVKIEGILTSGLEFHFDGKLSIATATKEMMEATGVDEDDMDDIAAIPSSIEGVCIGVTIRELSSPNEWKMSVRTRRPYNAQVICAHFGGGGHKQAAGCTVEKSLTDVKKELLEVVKKLLHFTKAAQNV
ncbi:MAG: bifunctional oligoribonuclease/PAP phosphatase NrnA [Oscillospiraceae bacterium]|jgi:phosphoesterase RecJ-like protein|nr:bifunctional oligoribonuclease/PAP phosphatase NrnA [Oscillospiraceae bacterium]